MQRSRPAFTMGWRLLDVGGLTPKLGMEDLIKLSARRWWLIYVLDVFIKAALVYLSAIFATLGLIVTAGPEPIALLLILAVALACLNAIYMVVARRLILAWIGQQSVLGSALILVFANALFAASLVALFSIKGEFFASAIVSLLLVATSLFALMVVAILNWMSVLVCALR